MGESSMLKSIMYVVFASLVVVAGVLVVKNTNLLSKAGSLTVIPKKVDVLYQDATFQPNLDDKNMLAVLQNPFRYEKEFNAMVEDYNLNVLLHLGNRMGLSDSLRNHLSLAYAHHHENLTAMIYKDFTALKDGGSADVASWYEQYASEAVEHFNEVMSRYICFMVSKTITDAIETDNGSFMAAGTKVETPCGIAFSEALQPTVQRLTKMAAIEDFGRSRNLMQEKIETAISELAVFEVRDKKGITKKNDTKVWRYSVSSTDIDISAISYLKIGFDLKSFFEIKIYPKSQSILVTLPEPEILSHEVFPKIEKLSIGWMREISEEDFNENLNLLRKAFLKDAKDDLVFDKAKEQAKDLVALMLDPVIASLNANYKLVVRFQEPKESFARR